MWLHTLRQLIRLQRSIPIAAVAVPLVVTQHYFSADKAVAGLISGVLVGSFVLVGPWSWRVAKHRGLGLLWPVLGGVPFVLGFVMSEVAEPFATFLLSSTTGVLSAALFLVGSWGLGRDIELEDGLIRMTARAEALDRSARSARILALQAHLDPHFLFNTLNAIAEWCVVDGERAEQAVLDLASVLRRISEAVQHERWPLAAEISLARSVLELHHARDPERFELYCPAVTSDQTVPPLLLLPLVENAITHGPARGHSGTVSLRVSEGDQVQIEVRNPGGFTGPREGGQGLAQVRERLELTWGERASFTISGDTETVANVRWPAG